MITLTRRGAGATLLGGLAAACSRPTATLEKTTLKVGHLVGVCMAPLFLADARGFFKAEGLNVELTWIPNPGDSVNALNTGSLDLIHNPFTNTAVAVDHGANLKIVAGSGNGGLSCVVQPETGIKTLADLKARARTGLKVGSERINTLELTFYRTIRKLGLSYDDFDMVWFHDHFAMLAAFQSKQVDMVTHVEPFVSQLLMGGGVEISNSTAAWGENSPDCVISARTQFIKSNPETLRRYLRAVLKADHEIKANPAAAVEALDKGKYYKVSRDVLAQALPRQPPGVDITKGLAAMDTAINDMLTLGYIKTKPAQLADLSVLNQVLKG